MTFTDDDFQRHRNRIKENLNADIVDSLLGGATADRRPVKEGDKDVFPVPPELTLAMPYTSGLDGTVIQLTDLFDGSTVNNSKVKLLLHLLMLDGKIPAQFVPTWSHRPRGNGRGGSQSTSSSLTKPAYVGDRFFNLAASSSSSSSSRRYNPITSQYRWGSVPFCNQVFSLEGQEGKEEKEEVGAVEEDASAGAGGDDAAPSCTRCPAVMLVGQKLLGNEGGISITFHGPCKHASGSRAGRLSGEVKAHVMGLVERSIGKGQSSSAP
jgi:hypothetical protein